MDCGSEVKKKEGGVQGDEMMLTKAVLEWGQGVIVLAVFLSANRL